MVLVAGGCSTPPGDVSPAPIPVGTSVGLNAQGSIAGGGGATFSLLLDTGTVLTSRNVGGASGPIANDSLVLYDIATPPVPRARFDDVPILQAQLSDIGIDGTTARYGGILAGDLLQRYALGLDYAASAITLLPTVRDCSCQLANGCNAVLPFTLAGGGRIALGEQIFNYPPTRVTADVCLEAEPDPLAKPEVPCRADNGGKYSRGYEVDQPPGTDVRLLVATGFPGILLGASAWDRLRGPGSARQLLATAATHRLHFANLLQDGEPAAQASLDAATAFVLVGREGLLGACGELARSRRLRWQAAHAGRYLPNCDASDTSCPDDASCLRCLPGNVCGDPNRCNDLNQPAAPYIELTGLPPVYIVDDSARILQEVNDDVRPLLSDVEGVIGTDVLAQLRLQIDYPSRRMIARCAEGTGPSAGTCKTFPRFACPAKVGDCGPRGTDAQALCNPPSRHTANAETPLCLPAPMR